MYVLWLAAELGVFENQGNQSTIVHLTREQLRAQRIPLPPASAQRRIVDALDLSRRRQRDIRRSLDRQLELLREHRQALITAAVTGELEVSGVAA
jgi:type I restriction enzyme S subunit